MSSGSLTQREASQPQGFSIPHLLASKGTDIHAGLATPIGTYWAVKLYMHI